MAAVAASFVREPNDRGVTPVADADGGTTDGDSDDAPGSTTAAAGTSTSITIAFTGDTLVHESVANSAAAHASSSPGGTVYDFAPMFAEIGDIIASADLALCHLETPISATNTDLAYFPAFRVPNQIADALAGAGFDACSTASNHSLDASPVGVMSTIAQLDRVGVEHTGTAADQADAARLRLFDVGGVTVGHLAATYGLNAGYEVPTDQPWLVDVSSPSEITASARELRAAGADIVVASLHWGVEYQSEPTPEQRTLAQQLIALVEVDLIVGHHAHVVQPIERIGSEYVVYGLGNMLSNQSPDADASLPTESQDGVIVLVTFESTGSGWVATELEAIPTWVDRARGHVVRRVDEPSPEIDATVAEASRARTLTVLDANGVL